MPNSDAIFDALVARRCRYVLYHLLEAALTDLASQHERPPTVARNEVRLSRLNRTSQSNETDDRLAVAGLR